MTQGEQAIKNLQDKLRRLPTIIQEEVHNELIASSLTIVRNAKAAAPVNFGTLRNSISFFERGPLDVSVTVNVNYAAYQEFGTGARVVVPEGFELIAAQFRGAGIRQHNMAPHPYLIPALVAERPLLVGRINAILDEAITKL